MSKRPVVLIPGDGIGPEIAAAVRRIFAAANAPIEWIEADAGLGAIERTGNGCPPETLDAVRRVGVALKGPTTTPIGGGHKSVNVTIRKALDLYANVRPSRSLPGITERTDVDLIIVRENIEDTYGGIEHMQSNDVAQCLRLITRPGCHKIMRYAFELTRRQRRRRLVCIQKANIMKITDGLFLDVFREVAKDYPDVEPSEMLVDNCCMQLVIRPSQFDVLVLPNLFGDIVSDLCAGLTGGLGVAPGGNIGDTQAVFEAVHGSAPDIAGQNKANPTALLLSSIAMLRHLGFLEHADGIEKALLETTKAGIKTGDLGGKETTTSFTDAICQRLSSGPAIVDAPGGEQPKTIGAVALQLPPAPKREVVGFDIFLHHEGQPALPAQVGPFALKMISNRGTKIYPGPRLDILMVDIHRCRFEAPAAVSDADVLKAVSDIEAAGFTWVHIEKLHHFGGKVGYTKAQGE